MPPGGRSELKALVGLPWSWASLGVPVLLKSPRSPPRSPCPICRDRQIAPRGWEAHPSPGGCLKLGLYPRLQKECKVSWKARALGKPPRLLHLSSEGAGSGSAGGGAETSSPAPGPPGPAKHTLRGRLEPSPGDLDWETPTMKAGVSIPALLGWLCFLVHGVLREGESQGAWKELWPRRGSVGGAG